MIVPAIGRTHQCGTACVRKITGMPSRKPKKKPKLMMNRSSRAPTSVKIRLHELRALVHVADHHELDVEQLIDVLADLAGDVADDVGQLAPDALVDARPHARRQVAPELRVLALHRALDELVESSCDDATMCSAISSGSSCS